MALGQQLGVTNTDHALNCIDPIACSGLYFDGYGDWSEVPILAKPDTRVSWHRVGYRLLWLWRSRQHWAGRPKVPECSDSEYIHRLAVPAPILFRTEIGARSRLDASGLPAGSPGPAVLRYPLQLGSNKPGRTAGFASRRLVDRHMAVNRDNQNSTAHFPLARYSGDSQTWLAAGIFIW